MTTSRSSEEQRMINAYQAYLEGKLLFPLDDAKTTEELTVAAKIINQKKFNRDKFELIQTKADKQLIVSGIPEISNLGLFAFTKFKASDIIIELDGDMVLKSNYNQLYPNIPLDAHSFSLDIDDGEKEEILIPTFKGTVGSFIKSTAKGNIDIVSCNDKLVIVANRNIEFGEEISFTNDQNVPRYEGAFLPNILANLGQFYNIPFDEFELLSIDGILKFSNLLRQYAFFKNDSKNNAYLDDENQIFIFNSDNDHHENKVKKFLKPWFNQIELTENGEPIDDKKLENGPDINFISSGRNLVILPRECFFELGLFATASFEKGIICKLGGKPIAIDSDDNSKPMDVFVVDNPNSDQELSINCRHDVSEGFFAQAIGNSKYANAIITVEKNEFVLKVKKGCIIKPGEEILVFYDQGYTLNVKKPVKIEAILSDMNQNQLSWKINYNYKNNKLNIQTEYNTLTSINLRKLYSGVNDQLKQQNVGFSFSTSNNNTLFQSEKLPSKKKRQNEKSKDKLKDKSKKFKGNLNSKDEVDSSDEQSNMRLKG